eukprot:CAMPEP_0116839394 /NCGR_PEP_ID=MMETSP0418-20121206/9745_1 /TAXON_ID=1158023 /ORGANISM="Astrosyne radiata, Strain 13vi08-1A" /LENGTH=57 /DNA_ID=CAMNT_0004469505 /DNA_START=1394 /DNA_END=1564 /DNA_ORIENTATION=-
MTFDYLWCLPRKMVLPVPAPNSLDAAHREFTPRVAGSWFPHLDAGAGIEVPCPWALG